MKQDKSQFLPLSPASLHILLALAREDLHGYGIMQEIARQSEGQYKRRRYYRLKGLGRNVLSMEVERLEGVLRDARWHLRALKPRRT